MVKNIKLETEYAKLKAKNVKYIKLKTKIAKFEAEEYAENEANIAKLKNGLQYIFNPFWAHWGCNS